MCVKKCGLSKPTCENKRKKKTIIHKILSNIIPNLLINEKVENENLCMKNKVVLESKTKNLLSNSPIQTLYSFQKNAELAKRCREKQTNFHLHA